MTSVRRDGEDRGYPGCLEKPKVAPDGQGVHDNRNAETYMLVGDAFGRKRVNRLK